jgi:hypothetical protein
VNRHHRPLDELVRPVHRRGHLQGRVAQGVGGNLRPAEVPVEILDLLPVALSVGAEGGAVQIIVAGELTAVDSEHDHASDDRDRGQVRQTGPHAHGEPDEERQGETNAVALVRVASPSAAPSATTHGQPRVVASVASATKQASQ